MHNRYRIIQTVEHKAEQLHKILNSVIIRTIQTDTLETLYNMQQ